MGGGEGVKGLWTTLGSALQPFWDLAQDGSTDTHV